MGHRGHGSGFILSTYRVEGWGLRVEGDLWVTGVMAQGLRARALQPQSVRGLGI